MKRRLIPIIVLLATAVAFYVFRADAVPWAQQTAARVRNQYELLIHHHIGPQDRRFYRLTS